ncbi:hypothetical protein M408DRAFT_325666 [Serendipita vermifera MAFF 305830]|uniref:UBC core domain-containing protein n=1 Tax=Serendipita vermifera MAFF 305830 TaxID=933852 RepID=A0A0C3BQ41_SERVB|nr:hypothetical protein M408DRAFT_325666 [Serendipita vermifera MAFF 305830]
MDTSQLFRDRLRRDLRELELNVDPGIRVHAAGHDMRRLCLHLTPQSGPWQGLTIHFSIDLPTNWPASPPRVWCSIPNLKHPNILTGGRVCCDLWRETSGGYSGFANVGYTPAYTLRGIFKQLLSLFSSKSISHNFSHGRTNLGQAIIVHYVHEAQFLFPFREPTSITSRNAAYPYTEPENYLEKLWNEDTSEEVVIVTYQSDDGSDVKQITKKSMMRDSSSASRGTQEPEPQEQTRAAASSRASKPVKRILKFESLNPAWLKARAKVQTFECNECDIKSANIPRWPVLDAVSSDRGTPAGEKDSPAYMTPAATNQLARLKMDLLHVLCEHMPDESLHALGVAYSPIAHFLRRTNFLRKRQVRCFYLATHYEDPPNQKVDPDPTKIMGMGVALDRRTNRLSCDTIIDGFLSEAAFLNCGVRRSIRKADFSFFLPLALNYDHFKQIKPRLFDCLKTLSAEISLTEPDRVYPPTRHGVESSAARSTRATTARHGSASSYSRGSTPVPGSTGSTTAEIDSVNVIFKFLRDVTVDYMHVTDDIINRAPVATRGVGSQNSSQEDVEALYSISLIHAAEKFLAAYWQLFHLLISLCRDNPALLKSIDGRVRQFVDTPNFRSKEFEPDLGEFVIVAALVFACQDEGLLPLKGSERRIKRGPPTPGSASSSTHRYDLRHGSAAPSDPIIRWSENFIGPLLQEAMTRSAVEVVAGNSDLQHFETGECAYRAAKSYQHSRETYRMIALQASILAVFTHYETAPRSSRVVPNSTQAHLDRQFGQPPTQAAQTLAEETKAGFRLTTWDDLFTKVQYKNGLEWSQAELASALRQCMIRSEQRGYHINNYRSGDARTRLVAIRERRERDWKRDHLRRMRAHK